MCHELTCKPGKHRYSSNIRQNKKKEKTTKMTETKTTTTTTTTTTTKKKKKKKKKEEEKQMREAFLTSFDHSLRFDRDRSIH